MMKSSSTLAFLMACLGLMVSSAFAVNYVEVIGVRVDDQAAGFSGFRGSVFVNLEDETGVTGVSVTAPGGMTALFDDSDGAGTSWYDETDYATLADLVNATSGVWTIDISGSSASSSAFTLISGGLVDADFFPIPTGLTPAHGATGVPVNTSFSWTDPTGPITPDVVDVYVGSESGNYQDNNSLMGDLAIDATMWTPMMDIDAGPNEWAVGYFEIVDPQAVTDLSVESGSITWGNSPFAPVNWPDGRPLVALGAETVAAFDAVPEPAALSLLGLGAFALVSRRRR
ncbi:PEP-CTERM sorting domain-containing protein [Planctomycetales bacterium ZRK34]|nr:PEP-CTERM sorting domain-containing protein [Planctomycetales bacterium ZRK34]